ncbi:GD14534 [Drosophila simulans]|uniref:GD14534 n=1 Tax=Drosophila simulans TaxID=7240 RepID=B4QKL8_DROSI|nr:GD14534 [Drosophila simulans]
MAAAGGGGYTLWVVGANPNIAGRKSASAILNRVINQEQQATKHKLRDVQI